MKLVDLLNDNIIEPDIDNLKSFLNEHDLVTLSGNNIYTLIDNNFNYYLLDEEQYFTTIKEAQDYIYKKYKDFTESDIIEEDLKYRRIHYKNYKHDEFPKLLILDDDYKYNKKGEVVKGQHDILGYNLNYGTTGSKKIINGIASIAKKSKKNNYDIYLMIKKNYPESLKMIRQYKRNYILNR